MSQQYWLDKQVVIRNVNTDWNADAWWNRSWISDFMVAESPEQSFMLVI